MENNINSVKKILADPKNFDKIVEIAESFGIAGRYGEGVNKLDEIFEKVFIGDLPPEKVKEEIKRAFGFGDELCEDIAKEMEKEIFSNYKEELNNLYSQGRPVEIEKEAEGEKKSIEGEKAESSASAEKNIQYLEEKNLSSQTDKQPKEPVKEKLDDVSSILAELEKEIKKERKE